MRLLASMGGQAPGTSWSSSFLTYHYFFTFLFDHARFFHFPGSVRTGSSVYTQQASHLFTKLSRDQPINSVRKADVSPRPIGYLKAANCYAVWKTGQGIRGIWSEMSLSWRFDARGSLWAMYDFLFWVGVKKVCYRESVAN
jgi:hypothetical protein